ATVNRRSLPFLGILRRWLKNLMFLLLHFLSSHVLWRLGEVVNDPYFLILGNLEQSSRMRILCPLSIGRNTIRLMSGMMRSAAQHRGRRNLSLLSTVMVDWKTFVLSSLVTLESSITWMILILPLNSNPR